MQISRRCSFLHGDGRMSARCSHRPTTRQCGPRFGCFPACPPSAHPNYLIDTELEGALFGVMGLRAARHNPAGEPTSARPSLHQATCTYIPPALDPVSHLARLKGNSKLLSSAGCIWLGGMAGGAMSREPHMFRAAFALESGSSRGEGSSWRMKSS